MAQFLRTITNDGEDGEDGDDGVWRGAGMLGMEPGPLSCWASSTSEPHTDEACAHGRHITGLTIAL
jgi:hypothetical protein